MKGIEDMRFSANADRDGKFVGRVEEFPDLKTRPMANRLDALDEIINKTRERLRDIAEAKAGM